MGPHDPFSRASRTQASPGGDLGVVPLLVGLFVGLVFGVVAVLAGFGAAVLVVLSGLAGMLLTWLVVNAARGRLDLRGAYRALLRDDR